MKRTVILPLVAQFHSSQTFVLEPHAVFRPYLASVLLPLGLPLPLWL